MSATCTSEITSILEKAIEGAELDRDEIVRLLSARDGEEKEALYKAADEVRKACVGDEIYLRGIIEFSAYCRRNCHYCGLRAQNRDIHRYRIPDEEILSRAKLLKERSCTTVVLQSGEDAYYNTERLCRIIRRIKDETALAITLSIGERSYGEYEAFREAGAERYLLRHETASRELYRSLHPGHELEDRIACLRMLKRLGYEVGSGCIVGLPGQSIADLADDVLLLKGLDIDMIGVGPFIPHPGTPLGSHPAGGTGPVLNMLAVLRLVTKDTNIPATTALGVLDPEARRRAFAAGANVFMPNFTPDPYTAYYEIYPGKGPEAGAIAKASDSGYAVFFEGMGRRIGTGYGYRTRKACTPETQSCPGGPQ
ncbi:MAG TPA: [FeFe] hydrogenase H-cluster radical SAM maturase HydE [Deltaproteobacteria bacterium]|nr:[FeFe] hydrogenase H-cluster radical SAM maturase HydE [Deltaproteobacteria bacterium]HQJ07869.1 [FeFe] hydrogenase H-cluster radical SAM maturase HydE [Deltaproteobacteria bacterium]